MRYFKIFLIFTTFMFLIGCDDLPIDTGKNPDIVDSEFKIHFHNDIGNEVSDMLNSEITELSDLPTLVFEGYDFLGWYLDEEFVNEFNISNPFDTDIDLYAKWVETEYTWVIWNKDNETSTEVIITISTNLSILLEPYETIEGYSFVEWLDKETDEIIYMTDVTLASISLYPIFSEEIYKVKFTSIQNIIMDEISVHYGDDFILPEPYLLEGYTFIGYYTSDIYDTIFTQTTMENNDVSVYMLYEINEYLVTLDATGGQFTDQELSFNVNYNEYLPEVEDPTLFGYRFLSWYLDEEYSTILPDDFYISGEVTLYAKWELMDNSLTFNTNGGNEISIYEYAVGESITSPTDPIRTGYNFDGWYEDGDFTTMFVFDTMLPGNIMLYAKWNPIKYIIYFTDFDDSIIKSFIFNYDHNLSEFIYPDDPIRTGYLFSGWTEDTLLTMPNNDVYIQATYNIGAYTITINTLGGNEIDPISGDYGTEISPPDDPIREGYTFNGWYSDYERTISYTFFDIPGEETTVYAKWTINFYTINVYNLDGDITFTKSVMYSSSFSPGLGVEIENYTFDGWFLDSTYETEMPSYFTVKEDLDFYPKYTGNPIVIKFDYHIPSIEISYGSQIGELAIAEREGFTFDGWYVYGSGTYDTIGEDYIITESLYLKATFSFNYYTITYITNGSDDINSETVKYYDQIYMKIIPEIEGMTFLGWYLDSDLTELFNLTRMPAEDLTLYAKWDIADYKLFFNNFTIRSSIIVPDYFIYYLNTGDILAVSYDSISNEYSNTDIIDLTDKFNSLYNGTIELIEGEFIYYEDGTIFERTTNYFDDISLIHTLYIEIEESQGISTFMEQIPTEVLKQYRFSYDDDYVVTESGKLYIRSDETTVLLPNETIPTIYTDCTEIFGLEQDEQIVEIVIVGGTYYIYTTHNRIFGWGYNVNYTIETPIDTNIEVESFYETPYDMSFKFDIESTDNIKFLVANSYTLLVITEQNRIFVMGKDYYGTTPVHFAPDWINLSDYSYNPNDFNFGHYDAVEITNGFDLEKGDSIKDLQLERELLVITTEYGRIYLGGYDFFNNNDRVAFSEVTQDIPLDNDEYVLNILISDYNYTFSVVTNKGRIFAMSKYDIYNIDGILSHSTSTFIELKSLIKQPILTTYFEIYQFDDLVSLENLTVDGYTFDGFYLDEFFTIPISDITMPDGSIQIYIKWMKKTYTITYHVDGGLTVDPTIYEVNTFINSLAIPHKDGHTFLGWYMDEELTIPYESEFMLPMDVDLYAKWEINTYNIHYIENWIIDIATKDTEHLVIDNFGRLFYWGFLDTNYKSSDYATVDPVDISKQITLLEDEKIIQVFFIGEKILIETDLGRILEIYIYEEYNPTIYTTVYILTDDPIVTREITELQLNEGEHIKKILEDDYLWKTLLLTTEGRLFSSKADVDYLDMVIENTTSIEYFEVTQAFGEIGIVEDIIIDTNGMAAVFIIDGNIYYIGTTDSVSTEIQSTPINISQLFGLDDVEFISLSSVNTYMGQLRIVALSEDNSYYRFGYEIYDYDEEELTYIEYIYTKNIETYYGIDTSSSARYFDGDSIIINTDEYLYYLNEYKMKAVDIPLLNDENVIEVYIEGYKTYYITNFGRIFVEGYNFDLSISTSLSEYIEVELMEQTSIFPDNISVVKSYEYTFNDALEDHVLQTTNLEFLDWYQDTSFTTPFRNIVMGPQDIYVYGEFEQNRFSFYLVDQDNIIYQYDVSEGFPIYLEQYAVEGYSFNDWYLDPEYTIEFIDGMLMTDSDLYIYTMRTINDYSVVAFDSCVQEIILSDDYLYTLYCDGTLTYEGTHYLMGTSYDDEVSVTDLIGLNEPVIDIVADRDSLYVLTESGLLYIIGGNHDEYSVFDEYSDDDYIELSVLLNLADGDQIIQLPETTEAGFDIGFVAYTLFGRFVGFNDSEWLSYIPIYNVDVLEFYVCYDDIVIISSDYQILIGDAYNGIEWDFINITKSGLEIIDIHPLDNYYFAIFYSDGTVSVYDNDFSYKLQSGIGMPYTPSQNTKMEHMFTINKDVYIVFNDGTIWKFASYQQFLNEEQTIWQNWYYIEDATDGYFLDGNLIQATYDNYYQSYIVYNDNDLYFIGYTIEGVTGVEYIEYTEFQYVDGFFANITTLIHQYDVHNYNDSLIDYTITVPEGYDIVGYVINGEYSITLDLPETISVGFEILVIIEPSS